MVLLSILQYEDTFPHKESRCQQTSSLEIISMQCVCMHARAHDHFCMDAYMEVKGQPSELVITILTWLIRSQEELSDRAFPKDIKYPRQKGIIFFLLNRKAMLLTPVIEPNKENIHGSLLDVLLLKCFKNRRKDISYLCPQTSKQGSRKKFYLLKLKTLLH